MKFDEIDTPALLLDLDAMERNLAKMARFFARPDAAAAALQEPQVPSASAPSDGCRSHRHDVCNTLRSGGFGLQWHHEHPHFRRTCRRPQDRRALSNWPRQADVKAVVDNPQGRCVAGSGGKAKGCRPGVLVNVNVGQNRTGVKPGEPVLELARQVLAEGLSIPRPHGLRGPRGASGGRAGKGVRLRSGHGHFDEVPLLSWKMAGFPWRPSAQAEPARTICRPGFPASPSFKPARTC